MVPQKKKETNQLEIQLIACLYLKNDKRDQRLLMMLLKKLSINNQDEKALHIERLKGWNKKRNKNKRRPR